jgi:hypothetical protein
VTTSLHVVTGPPCSGKSTHIRAHRDMHGPATVIDLDDIAHALGYPVHHVDWAEETPHPARVAAMIARASLVKAALTGKLAGEVWLTDTVVSGVAHQRYAAAGAEIVSIDPGREACLERARRDGRSAATVEQIEKWYGADEVGQTSEEW